MDFRKFLIPLAAAIGFASSPTSAALSLGSTDCANADISPTATNCVGWYEGNLNSGNSTDLNDSATAVNLLLGTSYTGATLPILEKLDGLNDATIVDFATQLYGQTVVSFHVGGAKGQSTGVGYNATAFFVFDAGAGLDTFAFNRAGLSNARLFVTQTPVVPEPGTWAMLILGFGLVGAAMRRRRRDAATQEYAHA